MKDFIRRRFAILLALLYPLLFLPLAKQVGPLALVAAALPVLAYAAHCGLRCSLAAVLLIMPFNALLIAWLDEWRVEEILDQRFWMIHGLILLAGIIAGRMHDLKTEAATQRARLHKAEAALAHCRRRLEMRSVTDDLTGLHNRRGFFELAGQQVAQAERLGYQLHLLCTDIDGMGSINEIMGADSGDKALIETARLLRDTVRDADDYTLSRIGGDEFAVLLSSKEPITGEHPVLSRLHHHLEQANARPGRHYQLSLTTVAIKHKSGGTLDSLLQETVRAMHEKWRQSEHRH